ncbi:autotransporter assembly complex protein TamA [Methylovulum psychrotolerans]|uniref:Outer membrane protein assembly factor n=1 Tax=Methylovulum psychrotolerans TaxID=1704499 RepID=A0A2S5CHG2_9GAMM|nr:autotransporter assembly complex family protein [Methylovulum psychrotolerans]POZ50229.1 outer membrane protein assembly factor [Methylovulum psychrotolerans]
MKLVFALRINGWILCLTLLAITAAYAADPQPYAVTIAKTGDTELDGMLAQVCTLISLKEVAPVGSFAMVARARADVGRFTAALQSLGYYQGKVQVRIADRPLDDRGIYDTIDYSPASPPIPVQITVEPGALFHVHNAVIEGSAPSEAKQWLGLKANAPARAADLQQAAEKLMLALQDHGYALAKVEEPIGQLLPDSHELDVSYRVVAGEPVTLGKVSVQGLAKVNPAFVDRRLKIASGQPFKLSDIEKDRQSLQATGVFSTVRVRLGEGQNPQKLDLQQHLPVTFVVGERLRHTIHLGAAYSTDLGGSLNNYWQHHNLFGYGEQLNLTAGVTQLGGNSTTGVGYNVAANFIKPDFLQIGQSLLVNVANIRQNLITYNEDVFLAEVQLSRKLSPVWTGTVGISPEQASITQQGETRDYTLASLPLSLKYDSTNNLLDPTHGNLATAALTPIESLQGSELHTFVIMQLSAASYLDFHTEGRSVLAVHGLLGNIAGAGRFDLPPDKRFYAGGSATVRGYRYQSIGPQFNDGNPQGGKGIATATVEFRQRLFEHYGVVAFTDAGQVSPDTLLASGDWRMGAGLGLRYYTSFGPLRLDVALPLNPQSNSGSFELYLGLGQAF